MEGIQRDIQHAIRNLFRHPGFLTIAVVTLALGIGGTTAIFSTVHALLVKPLDFPNPHRVVANVSESRSVGGTEIRIRQTTGG